MSIGTYTPPPLQIITQFFFYILDVQELMSCTSYRQCKNTVNVIFISISILWRSGVKCV